MDIGKNKRDSTVKNKTLLKNTKKTFYKAMQQRRSWLDGIPLRDYTY